MKRSKKKRLRREEMQKDIGEKKEKPLDRKAIAIVEIRKSLVKLKKMRKSKKLLKGQVIRIDERIEELRNYLSKNIYNKKSKED